MYCIIIVENRHIYALRSNAYSITTSDVIVYSGETVRTLQDHCDEVKSTMTLQDHYDEMKSAMTLQDYYDEVKSPLTLQNHGETK